LITVFRSSFGTACALIIALSSIACSSRPNATPAPDPVTSLQAIPPADPAKYAHLRDMKSWHNPYLVVRVDGIGLLQSADNTMIILKPAEVLSALAQLPASNWPYGRVVAVSENIAGSSEQDAIAIRRNKGIVGGILESAHVAIEWVSTS
jgi:hypothetical protein